MKFKAQSSLATDKPIGIICSVKMEGAVKKVQLESQVLIVNNLNRPVSIFVQDQTLKNYYPKDHERATMDPDAIFRVPLSWLFGSKNNAIFVEAKAMTYVLFKNLDDLFTDQGSASKLSQSSSTLVRLEHDYFASLDVQSFRCLPKVRADAPLQYLVSFNPPLMITNYNF